MRGYEVISGTVYILCLVPITYFDLTRRRIPDLFSYSCFALLLLIRIIAGNIPILPILSGVAGSMILMLFVRQLMKGGLGLGDVKLAASGGILLPGVAWLPALALASLLALAAVLPMVLTGHMDRRARIPFAPFIGAGTLGVYAATLFLPSFPFSG